MANKLLRLAKILLWKIDLFSSSQLLRYKSQNSYSTLTGGFLSLIIIIAFGTILIKDFIGVVTKSNITSMDFINYNQDPTFVSFSFDQNSKFILGVGIDKLNLNDPKRYFDINMTVQTYSYGYFDSSFSESLQPCEQDQWAVNQIGANSFYHANLSNFLCPSSNFTINLQGKFSSKYFRFLLISIGPCHNQTVPSRPCVDSSIVNKNSEYGVSFYFMNPYVNSGDENPVRYYFQDRNYFMFNSDSTTIGNLYLTQHTIYTDNNIFPWSEIESETVLLVKQAAQVKYDKYVNPDQSFNYMNFYIRKSPYEMISQRSFQKIDNLLSAIGGLFGFTIIFFIFIRHYAEASFQIQMGDRLFHYRDDSPLKAESYNIFFHVLYCLYYLLKKINIEIPWRRMQIYQQCREEVVRQLDVSLLMNKITFLEKCMNAVFESHQFRAIYLQQKPSVKQAQSLRINHGLNKLIHKKSNNIDKKFREKIKKRHSLVNKVSLQHPDPEELLQSGKEVMKKSSQSQDMKNTHLQQPKSQSFQINRLISIMFDYIMSDKNRKKEPSGPQIDKKSDKQSQQSNQNDAQQLQEVAEQNHESLRFVQTALNDIKQIEAQAKKGNKMSQRIYNQINNDITKDQIVILKCIESIVAKKEQRRIHISRRNSSPNSPIIGHQSQQAFRYSKNIARSNSMRNWTSNNAVMPRVNQMKEQQKPGIDILTIIQSQEL